jgi:hypothetical protein
MYISYRKERAYGDKTLGMTAIMLSVAFDSIDTVMSLCLL